MSLHFFDNLVSAPIGTQPYGAPSPLSHYPASGTFLSTNLGFFDRIKNVVQYHILIDFVIPYFDKVADELRFKHGLTMSARESASKLGIIITSTSWPLELPHPIMPVHKAIGPVLAEAGKPLPEVWNPS